jgi:hypothetical protein
MSSTNNSCVICKAKVFGDDIGKLVKGKVICKYCFIEEKNEIKSKGRSGPNFNTLELVRLSLILAKYENHEDPEQRIQVFSQDRGKFGEKETAQMRGAKNVMDSNWKKLAELFKNKDLNLEFPDAAFTNEKSYQVVKAMNSKYYLVGREMVTLKRKVDELRSLISGFNDERSGEENINEFDKAKRHVKQKEDRARISKEEIEYKAMCIIICSQIHSMMAKTIPGGKESAIEVFRGVKMEIPIDPENGVEENENSDVVHIKREQSSELQNPTSFKRQKTTSNFKEIAEDLKVATIDLRDSIKRKSEAKVESRLDKLLKELKEFTPVHTAILNAKDDPIAVSLVKEIMEDLLKAIKAEMTNI